MVLGFTFILSVKHSGYEVKRGRCIDHGNRVTTLFGKMRRGADYFILETENEVIKVPATARKDAPPLDSFVEIYVAKNAFEYNSGGFTTYSPIFGFSVIAEGSLEHHE